MDQSNTSDELTPTAALVSLVGRRAVVTGAGRGIGAAIAHRLADAGAAVAVADVDPESATQTAKAIASTGATAIAIDLDVSDITATEQAAGQAVSELGGIDIWVNNAGVLAPTGPVEDTDDELFDRIVSVNLRGAFNCSRAAVRHLGSGGVIVNIASTTAFRPIPFATAYIATKTAIVGMTRALAIELAPRGIRVLGVAPGFVATPGSMAVMGSVGLPDDELAAAIGTTPLGRVVAPDDIAKAVLFCASDLASSVTGVVLPVDGGAIL